MGPTDQGVADSQARAIRDGQSSSPRGCCLWGAATLARSGRSAGGRREPSRTAFGGRTQHQKEPVGAWRYPTSIQPGTCARVYTDAAKRLGSHPRPAFRKLQIGCFPLQPPDNAETDWTNRCSLRRLQEEAASIGHQA